MQNVLLVINLLACIALIAVVLLQRSEGGALGMGGGGGDGLISGRGAANALTRATMLFAAVFLISCIALTALSTRDRDRTLDELNLLDGGNGSVTDQLDDLNEIDLGGFGQNTDGASEGETTDDLSNTGDDDTADVTDDLDVIEIPETTETP